MGKKNQGGDNPQGGGGGGCTINPTTKWAVWDAPGVTQPKSVPVSSAGAAGKKPPNNNKANNNSRFFAASQSTGTTTGEGSGPSRNAAKLQCQCGEVVISLVYPPLKRSECCCCDCRKALQWLQEKAGNGSSSNSLLKVDLIYFPNCFQVEQGGEFLEVFMIKRNLNTKRIVASCCQTALMGDHPAYQQERIVTYNITPSTLTLPKDVAETDLMPPQKRIFECDLTDAEKATLGPFEQKQPQAATASADDMNKWKTKYPKYTTIQSLIASVGPLQYMDPNYDGKETEWNKQLGLSSAAGL